MSIFEEMTKLSKLERTLTSNINMDIQYSNMFQKIAIICSHIKMNIQDFKTI